MSLSQSRKELFNSLWEEAVEAIELLRLDHTDLPYLKGRDHQVYVWDATRLPTNNHYVPVFIQLLESLEESGEISPDRSILVETTTGNAGVACAYVASKLEYPLIVFMPRDMPPTRTRDVEHYLANCPRGSRLELTRPGGYVAGMVRDFRKFLAKNRSINGRKPIALDHSRRPESLAAMESIGDLLMEKLDATRKVDFFVSALGNGTNTTGLGAAIKRRNPDLQIIGVEPIESPWFFEKKNPGEFEKRHKKKPAHRQHRLIGTGGWDVEFPNVNLEMLESIELVEDNSWTGALEKLKKAGYSVGHSSAACQHVIEHYSLIFSDDSPITFFSVFYDPLNRYQQ